MRDFDKSFNRTRNTVKFIFGVITIGLLLFFGAIAFLGVKVTSDPEGTAEKVGEVARSWKDAFEKGYKVEVADESDTLVIDTLNVK